MKKAKYNSKLMSPKGDVETYNDGEFRRAFPRKIKDAGGTFHAASHLRFKKAMMENDPGSGVRQSSKDSVLQC